MGKKIAVWAYLANNLGDDLFVQMLCLRYPDVQFYMQCLQFPNKTLQAIENLHFSELPEGCEDALAKDVPAGMFMDYYARFDPVVLVGGSVFRQYEGVPIHRHFVYLQAAKKLFVIGANFGPYVDQWFLDRYRLWFAGAEDVCFRDATSVGYFPGLKNVRWAPDVLFGHPADTGPKRQESGIVLVSPIDCGAPGRYPERPQWSKQCLKGYEDGLAAICLEFARRGYGIKLVPFCINEGDMLAAQRIMERCFDQGESNVWISPYTGDISATLNEIAGAEYIVATRFHAMILGWIYGKPTYPIVYSRKHEAVIRDMNFQGAYCGIGEVGSVPPGEVVDTLINNKFFSCGNAMKQAQKQFLALDRFLK